MRHPELGLHYVSAGALRHGLGSPVCTEYSRALTTRPRRLLEGDALVLSALETIAHFEPLLWVIENPATGLLKTRPFMERLPWVDVTTVRTPYRKQTRLWTTCAGGQGEASGPRSGGLMEGQCERVSQERLSIPD